MKSFLSSKFDKLENQYMHWIIDFKAWIFFQYVRGLTHASPGCVVWI